MEKFFKNGNKVMFALVSLLFSLLLIPKAALSQNIEGMAGTFVPYGTSTYTLSGTKLSSTQGPTSHCYHGAIMSPNLLNWPLTSASYPATATIGDYTGILLDDGLLYVIYSGTLKTQSLNPGTLDDGLVTFDSRGKAQPGSNTYLYKDNCWTTYSSVANSPNSTISVMVLTGIYIPENYPKGVVNLKNVYAANANFSSSSNIPRLFTSVDTLTVKPALLSCTTSAPPTIDFDRVSITNVPENVLLASKSQGLTLNCSSASSDIAADMTLSFTGGYTNGDVRRLEILDSENKQLAYIRGKYADTGGSCQVDGDSIAFDGQQGTKVYPQVGVGQKTLPILWSLCSNGSGLLGQGSAQATAIINWD